MLEGVEEAAVWGLDGGSSEEGGSGRMVWGLGVGACEAGGIS